MAVSGGVGVNNRDWASLSWGSGCVGYHSFDDNACTEKARVHKMRHRDTYDVINIMIYQRKEEIWRPIYRDQYIEIQINIDIHIFNI